VVSVRDGAVVLPFADAMLARTLVTTGVSAEEALDVAAEVRRRLGTADRVVPIDEVRDATALTLERRGLLDVVRRLRVRWWIRAARQPFAVLVGGTSGVGKSTVSQAAAAVLGIDRVFSSDLVRAVLRGTLNPDLLPALSESSFSAQRMLRSNLEGDPLLTAFEQQASLVSQATVPLVRRALKEGVQIVVNGVHLVPGLMVVPPDWPVVSAVLTVPDVDEHERRFTARVETSDRNAEHYLARLAAIRDLDRYIVSHARRADVPVVESHTFDQTVADLVGAVVDGLTRLFDIDGAGPPRRSTS
jgi:2-phosphoglycerate kinase